MSIYNSQSYKYVLRYNNVGYKYREVYKAVNGMTANYIQELFEVKQIPYNLTL